MAKQKYVIRQISALGIISASKGENGDRRFFFDATDNSKEYLVEETKQDDCEYVVFPVANFQRLLRLNDLFKEKTPATPSVRLRPRRTPRAVSAEGQVVTGIRLNYS